MKLCIDLDGVIVRYDFQQIVWEHFGVSIDEKSIFAYDLADVLGVSPEDIDQMFKEQVFGEPNFIEGALKTLTEWEAKGYDIFIWSNRVKYMKLNGLADWLLKYGIPCSGIDGGSDSYDFHIDDSPSKLMQTDSKMKLLFDQPWNRRCLNITNELRRVSSWQEIKEIVG